MRIGIVTTWFERGAAYVSRQYRDVLSCDHDVFIYARGGEVYARGDRNWDDDRVTWGKPTLSYLPTSIDIADFKNWIRTNDISLVLFNEQHWWTPVILCRSLGVPVGTYVDYYTEQTVPFFDVFDFVMCNTQRHHSVFKWHPQCFYVPWGTDTDLFAQATTGAVEPGIVTFFHSGGVSPHRKGCDLVLEAFSQLEGPARLVVHVQKPLKAVFPQLTGVIQAMEAAGRMAVVEESVPAPGLFHRGDIYVYPTRLEGIGLTILEASASGLPVIATGDQPMTEFVVHGRNGRHVRVDRYVSRADGYYWPQAIADVDDLREQMEWYVRQSASISELKARARKHALDHFDWRKNAKGLSTLFASVRRRSDESVAPVIDEIVRFEAQRRKRYLPRGSKLLLRALKVRQPGLCSVVSRWRAALRSSS